MDTRIPVRLLPAGAPIPAAAAVLTEGHAPVEGGVTVVRLAPASGPVIACACCAPRGQAGQALHRLFMARARGEVPFFREVVAFVADPQALRATLAGDVLIQARFRAA